MDRARQRTTRCRLMVERARHYCLVTGWGTSYPETTGYIIPTLIREARLSGDHSLLERARRMLDWLVSESKCRVVPLGRQIGDAPLFRSRLTPVRS